MGRELVGAALDPGFRRDDGGGEERRHPGESRDPGPFGRTFLPALFLLLAAACAHVEAPPGGPEDRTPPAVVLMSPEQEAVVESYEGPVIFQFDERISETGAEDAVIVSPRTSPVEVSRGRSEIRVSLRNGWQPGVIYQVTLLPQVRDLFNNPLAEPVQLVFSTGPAIPETRVSGLVVDRITGRPAGDIRVEAIRTADSLVYAIETGSEGTFELGRIPEGDYLLRAFQDMNADRELDPYEPRDSTAATITEADPTDISLSILQPDSTGPAIASVTGNDRIIEIELDDYMDPAQEVGPEQIIVVHPEAGALSIARVAIGNLPPADTAALPADTLPAPVGAPAPVAPPLPTEVETLPSQILAAELAEGFDLEPDVEYTVRIIGIRNINGILGDAEGTLEVDSPPPDL